MEGALTIFVGGPMPLVPCWLQAWPVHFRSAHPRVSHIFTFDGPHWPHPNLGPIPYIRRHVERLTPVTPQTETQKRVDKMTATQRARCVILCFRRQNFACKIDNAIAMFCIGAFETKGNVCSKFFYCTQLKPVISLFL